MSDAQGTVLPNGTQGTGLPNDGQNAEGGPSPKYVTEEQLNKAISARFSSFEKKLDARETALTEKLITAVGSSLDEKLTAFRAELPKPEEGKGKGKDQQPAAPKLEESPEWKAMQKKLADLEAKSAADAQTAATERAKSRDVKLRQAVRDALAEHRIVGTSAKGAMALLVDSDKCVRYAADDSDDLVFIEGDEEKSLVDGIKDWAGTEPAKIYLPPLGARGSGDAPVRGIGGGDSKDPRTAIGNALIKQMRP